MNTFHETGPGSEGVRERQKRETADAILEAARNEFERVGFERASLRNIATQAGVSAGNVVHHFESKHGLLHAAFFADLERVLDTALTRPGPGPLERQLARLSRAAFRYYAARPLLSRTLLSHSLFADPPWAERFAKQVERLHAAVAQLASEAIARGELRQSVDVQRLAASYLSFYYFGLIGWAQGAAIQPDTLVAGLLDQHLEGLRRRGQGSAK